MRRAPMAAITTEHGMTYSLPGIGRTRYLVGADGARSRVAQRCGLGEVRDFLYGIEYEFPGAQLARPGALHCFVSKRFAPGYIGWLAQNPTGIQAGLALRHDPRNSRVPDLDAFLLHVGLAGGLPRPVRVGIGAGLKSYRARAAPPAPVRAGPEVSLERTLLQTGSVWISWTRAEVELGYGPVVSFGEGLRRSIAWLESAGYPVVS